MERSDEADRGYSGRTDHLPLDLPSTSAWSSASSGNNTGSAATRLDRLVPPSRTYSAGCCPFLSEPEGLTRSTSSTIDGEHPHHAMTLGPWSRQHPVLLRRLD